MARSFNRIELIGNLTHSPEMRTTPKGTLVCAFSLATNRTWTGDGGVRQEESAFHRIVAWKTLAEQCGKFLHKGSRVFVAGRLGYRSYEKDGIEVSVAEVVIDEMILLDGKPTGQGERVVPDPVPLSTDDLAEEIPF